MAKTRIAVVGCGVISRLRHLPALMLRSSRCEVVALCDVDSRAALAAAPFAQTAALYTSVEQLLDPLAGSPIDAVLLASSGNHVNELERLSRAGVHVLCEKPLSLTLPAAERIARFPGWRERILQVGYMKQHASLPQQSAEVRRAHSVHSQLIHPKEDAYLAAAGGVQRPGGDFARFIRAMTGPESEVGLFLAGAGVEEDALRCSYFLLATSVVHNINLIRSQVGPCELVARHVTRDGLSATYLLKAGTTRVSITYDFTDSTVFDDRIQLVFDGHVVEHRYSSPYLRNAPNRSSVRYLSEGVETESSSSSAHDLFLCQLDSFLDRVQGIDVGEATIGTSPECAVEDLKLILSMVQS